MALARSKRNQENSNDRCSVAMRDQVAQARDRAERRLAGTPWRTNSQVPGSYLRKHFSLSTSVSLKLERALEQGRISMRGYDRCLRVAWSVADLAGRDLPNEFDVAKAIFLRGSDDLVGINNG